MRMSRQIAALMLNTVCMISLQHCFLGSVRIPQAPMATAPQPVREQYFNAYRPMNGVELAAMNPERRDTLGLTPRSVLFLANGNRVENPLDLAPAINTESLAGRAMRSLRDQEYAARTLLYSSLAATVMGSFFFVLGTTQFQAGTSVHPMTYFGATIGGIGAVGLYVDALLWFALPGMRDHIFTTYEDSLRDRLGFCGDGTHVGDCARVNR